LNRQQIHEVCRRLTMTEKNEGRVITAIRETETISRQIHSIVEPEKSRIYNILKSMPTETLLYTMAGTEDEHVKKAISLYFTQLKRTRLIIRGEDLKRLGIIPGKIFKDILNNLLNAKLDGIIETKEDEINFVKENYLSVGVEGTGNKGSLN